VRASPTNLLCGVALALLVSLCPQMPLAQDEPGRDPVVLTADEVSFDTETEIVTATGNVELSTGGRRLLADRITYDEPNDRAMAMGNVVLLEPTGQTFFADELEVTGDLRAATIESLRALVGEQTRLAARRATRREGAINELERASYSACPVCAESGPLWQINAERVIWDETAETVTYRNATLRFLGVPVAWVPWFFHPDPTVERKTGLLAPTFGTSSALGLMLETPAYITFAPNLDLTLTPMFTSQAGPWLGAQLRSLETFGTTMLGGSITQTDSANERNTSDEDIRGHVRGSGRYSLSDQVNAGFDVFWTTDDTYLDRYDISSSSLLANDIFLERIAGPDFLSLSAFAWQGLREGDDQDMFPLVLPLAEASLRSSPLMWGSHATLDANLVALTREEGLDTRRLTNEIGWEVPFLGPIGDTLRFRTSLRGDFYQYEGEPRTLGEDGGSHSKARGIPRATLDWSWPLLGTVAGSNFYLEPTTMVTVAPYGLNDEDIPNEDSRVFEFDETNLFEPNRFTGTDLVDEGVRLAYGLRFGSLGNQLLDISGVIGQSWQPREPDEFPEDSGVNSKFSDYVGRIDLRPSDYFNLRYRFRLDQSDLSLRRNDVKVSIGPPRLRFDVGYIGLSDEAEGLAERSREELILGLRMQPVEELTLAAQVRRDLSRGSQVSNMVGLLYTHPCLQILAGLEQSFTSRGELDDEITFKVRVTLATLGSIQGGS
jgi:LPS-assembly protein